MCPDERLLPMNVQANECHVLDESTTNERQQSQEEQIAQSMTTLAIHKEKLSAFCGLWEDYPSHCYRMEFRIEMNELIGYSNVHAGKAYAKFDGQLIHMTIIHRKEANRPLDRYRGRLGWNGTYIIWEKKIVSVKVVGVRLEDG